jgi:hypothetical protein
VAILSFCSAGRFRACAHPCRSGEQGHVFTYLSILALINAPVAYKEVRCQLGHYRELNTKNYYARLVRTSFATISRTAFAHPAIEALLRKSELSNNAPLSELLQPKTLALLLSMEYIVMSSYRGNHRSVMYRAVSAVRNYLQKYLAESFQQQTILATKAAACMGAVVDLKRIMGSTLPTKSFLCTDLTFDLPSPSSVPFRHSY